MIHKILIIGLIVSIISVALTVFIVENEKVLIGSTCIGSLCGMILGLLSVHNDIRKYNERDDN